MELPPTPGERPDTPEPPATPALGDPLDQPTGDGSRTEPPPTATATISEQGIITGWSQEARHLLGYNAAHIMGRPATQLLADTSAPTAPPMPGQDHLTGTLTLRHHDGHALPLPVHAHRRTTTGGITEWLVTATTAGPTDQSPDRPIAETDAPSTTAPGAQARQDDSREAAGEEMAGEGALGEELLGEWAFTQSPCLQAIFDTDLRLIRANTGMQDALSRTQDQIRGLRLTDIAPGPAAEETEHTMRLALRTGHPQQAHTPLPAADGTDPCPPATLTPLKDPRGHTRALCLATHHPSHEHPSHHQQMHVMNDSGTHTAEPDIARHPRQRTTTMTLQRSLLPHTLPDQNALDIASRYLPAHTEAGVGGDWFDVIPLSGTRVALVVGDVPGHGIRASATMGRLRTAVRTLADVDLQPDELLTRLDDLVTHLTTEETDTTSGTGTTCLYAIYDPISRICTLARAGHPPPAAVDPNGHAYFLDLPAGPPLGLGTPPFESATTQLPEGTLLAFYTNGLLNPQYTDPDETLSSLLVALAQPSPSLDTTCDRILTTLLTHPPTDDIALLVARTKTLPTHRIATFDLPFHPATVARARHHATTQLTAWNLSHHTSTTELIVSELVTNAIRYGKPPIQLRLIHNTGTLITELHDTSHTTPHLQHAHPNDENGRGLYLIHQLTQHWGTRHTATGKTIWTEQSLTPP
ncbi:SpoIIE family protein phosphatase [Streptomyces sp. NPDC091376]|uniref:SpoIIE family protein phosphatase n=1 Tax=Streptomyces sp. NPDC091376 TaxID=3365994 RepID=UPI00382592E2